MKTYHIINFHLVEENFQISRSFVDDMREVKDGKIAVKMVRKNDTQLSIERVDGKRWRNSSTEWVHNNTKYPIFAERPVELLPKELFEL